MTCNWNNYGDCDDSSNWSYETLGENGNTLNPDEPVYVYLYPNNSSDESVARNDIFPAIKQALEQARTAGSIDFWHVDIDTCFPGIPTNISGGDHFDCWKSYIHNTSRDLYTGCHLGVTAGYDSAQSQGADSKAGLCNTAFNYPKVGYVGTDGVKGRYEGLSIMETLHTFIDYYKIDDTKYVKSGGTNPHLHEHDLGTITPFDDITPMAAIYANNHAQHGDCSSSGSWFTGYTNSITNCTEEAIKITADNCT